QRREAGFCLNVTLVARENCVSTRHALHKQFTGFPQCRILIFPLVKNKIRVTELRKEKIFFAARKFFVAAISAGRELAQACPAALRLHCPGPTGPSRCGFRSWRCRYAAIETCFAAKHS